MRYGLDSAGKGKKSMRSPVRKIRMEYEGWIWGYKQVAFLFFFACCYLDGSIVAHLGPWQLPTPAVRSCGKRSRSVYTAMCKRLRSDNEEQNGVEIDEWDIWMCAGLILWSLHITTEVSSCDLKGPHFCFLSFSSCIKTVPLGVAISILECWQDMSRDGD